MRRVIVLALAALGPLPIAAGCQKSMAPVCRQICECSPCTGADFDACVEKAEAAQDQATDRGCVPQFEDFIGCFETTVTCEQGPASTSRCTRVGEALRACAGRGNPFATVCEEAAQRISECIQGTVKPSSTCSPQEACQGACVVAADCDVILGKKSDPAFSDCTIACLGAVSPPPPF
jgi:hypothetical protein